MKKILIFGLLMGFCVLAHGQSKSVASLYEKYKGNEDFFHMDMAGSFFNFADGFDIDFDEEGIKAIAKSVDRMKLFKLPVNRSAAQQDFRDLQKGLKKEKFDLMMEMSEKGSEIMFFSKGDNIINDLVLLIGSDDDGGFLVIELEGQFESKAIAEAMP